MSNLSDRIRPNSEAAPWVCDEVEKLERRLDAAISRFESSQEARATLKRERDEAREQIVKAKVALQQVDLPDEPLSIQAERIVEQLQWQIGINHGQANQIDAANNKHLEWLELLKELQGALKKCASIISGENMNKNGLIDALESSRSALAKAKEVLP